MRKKIADLFGFLAKLVSIVIPLVIVMWGIIELVFFSSNVYKISTVSLVVIECVVVALSIFIENILDK